MIFPTVRTLEAIGRFSTAEDVVRHAEHIGSIDPILPRVVSEHGGLRILLPGDEVYDAVTSQRLRG